MKRTSLLVNRLVVWTIETGLVTSLTEVAELACFLTMRNNSVWMGISSVVSGIYLNSMLAALNRRSILRRDLPIVHDFPTGDLATKRFDNNMVTVDVIPSGVNEYPRCENHTAVVGTLNGFPQNR
ncbi:hypothetical protein HYDPIDRAFT_110231 [Hydnomerulius pinastri MD-312]|nr:hypothetical protein HYDPIDRAFT_110231 [Hydnomerulius pinastri MD-312]